MNETTRNLLFVIVSVLGLMILAWFFQITKFFAYLREKHPGEYEAMGRPSVLANNTFSNNIAFLCFIIGDKPATLGDARLEGWCRFLARFFYAYMVLFLIAVGSILSAPANAQGAAGIQPAVPVDPVDGIVEAFRSHSVVALTEGIGHGNEQGHAFVVTLLQDPRFSEVADDIVVEWGNALYQDLIDRYTRGDEVPYSELRQVWENTTQPGTVWDRPVYREFFDAVRARKANLPAAEQLRVLLGDPPVDWAQIQVDNADLEQFGRERDAHPAALIQNEVIAKGRRA